MRILIACDSFKESLSAQDVCATIADAFRAVFPAARIHTMPLADGGEGTADILARATGGQLHERVVAGPLGDPVRARLATLGDGETAVVELAEAAGLALVPPALRDPRYSSTFGVGELISAAFDFGCTRIVLALGGSATNDGGAGIAQALGVRFEDAAGVALARGGIHLADLARVEIAGLDPRVRGAQIEIACDVDNPLCGVRGASAVFGPQKGATPAMVEALDTALAHYASRLGAALGHDLQTMPGGGAAGGAGYGAVALLGGRLRPGMEIVADLLGLDETIAQADLVITGEGRLDRQTLAGKVPMGVARLASARGVPVIAIAGSLGPGCDDLAGCGIGAMFDIVPKPQTLAEALDGARDNLGRTARNVARVLALGGQFAAG